MLTPARTSILLIGLLGMTSACSEDETGAKVVDALIVAQDDIRAAIEADPDGWTTQLPTGVDISGQIDAPNGGRVEVSGWRFAEEQQAASGFHSVFGEKLFLSFDSYAVLDVTLSGPLVITTHTLDFGQLDSGNIEDANRTTGYTGVLNATGAATGTFQVEVNGITANNTQWTCGKVNGEAYGHGACY